MTKNKETTGFIAETDEYIEITMPKDAARISVNWGTGDDLKVSYCKDKAHELRDMGERMLWWAKELDRTEKSL